MVKQENTENISGFVIITLKEYRTLYGILCYVSFYLYKIRESTACCTRLAPQAKPSDILLKNIHRMFFFTQNPLTGSIPVPIYANKKTDTCVSVFLFGDPYGNRTHDSTLRGWRLSRLTNRPFIQPHYYIKGFGKCQQVN